MSYILGIFPHFLEKLLDWSWVIHSDVIIFLRTGSLRQSKVDLNNISF